MKPQPRGLPCSHLLCHPDPSCCHDDQGFAQSQNLSMFYMLMFLYQSRNCNQIWRHKVRNLRLVKSRLDSPRQEKPAEPVPAWAELTEDQWRQRLSPEAFYVLRQKGTEPRYTGSYHNNKKSGSYVCAGCGTGLFSSEQKYDSGTGWPSFWGPAQEENVATESDNSFFSRRIEVLCAKCDGHLGHVFDDGPAPSGLRYCINAVSLKFVEAGKKEDSEDTSEP